MLNKAMAFYPLPEEELSLMAIDLLFFGGLALQMLVVPAAQLLLAWLYFRFAHGWSRLLNREIGRYAEEAGQTNAAQVTKL